MNLLPTILYAEDDADDRFFLSKTLAEFPVPVNLVYVADGEEVLNYLSMADATHNYPALVVLDLNMPRKDGKQTLQAIKANPALRTLPVVILSTSPSRVDKEYCRAQGAENYLQKPNSIGGYQHILRSFLPYLSHS